jgi:Homeodomain-like domain
MQLVRGSYANRRLRDRGQAILTAAHGRPHRQIAEGLGMSVRALQRWLNAYQARGLAGPTIQWAAGRVPRLPTALASEVLTGIKHGPAGCGASTKTAGSFARRWRPSTSELVQESYYGDLAASLPEEVMPSEAERGYHG